MMTAFYMFRLYFLTFSGKFRGTDEQHHHLHESPKSMTIPLMVLAVLSVVGGAIGIPGSHLLDHFLNPGSAGHHVDWAHEILLMSIATILAVAAIFLAYTVYVKRGTLPAEKEESMSRMQRIVYNKYYVDELFNAVIRKPLDFISSVAYRFIELPVIDGIVNGVGSSVKWLGGTVRLLQAGNVGFYIFAMTLAAIAMLYFTIIN
ncbi:MAG: NADH-quinone oxidoreductase subunit L, partial [Bacteroidia bacterium]